MCSILREGKAHHDHRVECHHIHTCMHTYMQTHTRTHTHTHAHTRTHTHTHAHTRTHTHTHAHTRTHTHTHAHTRTHTHTHAHTRTHAHTHTRTHAHTHTHTRLHDVATYKPQSTQTAITRPSSLSLWNMRAETAIDPQTLNPRVWKSRSPNPKPKLEILNPKPETRSFI